MTALALSLSVALVGATVVTGIPELAVLGVVLGAVVLRRERASA
jgi:hypothetical protein